MITALVRLFNKAAQLHDVLKCPLKYDKYRLLYYIYNPADMSIGRLVHPD